MTNTEPLRREGDRPVRTLSPDAVLVIDSSCCIVLATPERRVTVTNVADWREGLTLAKQFQQIYTDDAEQRVYVEDTRDWPGDGPHPDHWERRQRDRHEYRPTERVGNPCEVCGFDRHHPWHA